MSAGRHQTPTQKHKAQLAALTSTLDEQKELLKLFVQYIEQHEHRWMANHLRCVSCPLLERVKAFTEEPSQKGVA